LEPQPHFWRQQQWLKRAVYHDVSNRLVFLNPGLHRVSLRRDYDLFLVACQNHWDLLYINAIDRWWERCRTSVCWLDEMWAFDVLACRHWMSALKRFDYVFVGFSGTVRALSDMLGKPCRYLPMGIDTLRFSPYPSRPSRVIDVYSVGRRLEAIHEALLQVSSERGLFYAYDTFQNLANADVENPSHHRQFLASMAKRSRYFIVAPAKANASHETHEQSEFGYRYFEAAAAGAVMIGQKPETDSFETAFGWPKSVITVRPDGSDIGGVITELDSQPSLLAAISQRNAAESLLRHDWAYRWQDLLKACGMQPPEGLVRREIKLKKLSNCAMRMCDRV
jgi:glycosyltransferase involved in cell wall biosynthesis